jgi:hypothetical protein
MKLFFQNGKNIFSQRRKGRKEKPNYSGFKPTTLSFPLRLCVLCAFARDALVQLFISG